MAFLVVKEESVSKEGGSNYITKSGIYDLTLKHAQVAKTTNGATQINYMFDKAMSYGNTIIGVDGVTPLYGYKILEGLAATLGEEELSDPEETTVTFKKGTKELLCIPELNDVPVKAWIKFSYRMYQGEIREEVSVRRFYRQSDGASGSEVMTGENIGERLAKDLPYAEEIGYEDGVTADAVAAWKKAQAGGKDAPVAKPVSGVFPTKAKSRFPGVK